ncbi:MAG: hypothetical protein K9J21_12210, partial [Bacteroidales bacterium]|nr:hypothetical protein [Bacteroidales bacterium]
RQAKSTNRVSATLYKTLFTNHNSLRGKLSFDKVKFCYKSLKIRHDSILGAERKNGRNQKAQIPKPLPLPWSNSFPATGKPALFPQNGAGTLQSGL